MRLLGRTSSINVRKVLWTAAEIGLVLEHEDRWAGPGGDTRTAAFLALNPNGLVPVWIDDAGPLWESNTICRYLAARHGRADLLPIHVAARAQVEMWMDWQASDLNGAWRYAFMSLVRRHPDFADPAQAARSWADWQRLMGLLERQLERTGAFVAGEAFTLADVVLGLSVHRWRETPGARPAAPALEAYFERLSARPAAAGLLTPELP